jgi:hypothetical protein
MKGCPSLLFRSLLLTPLAMMGWLPVVLSADAPRREFVEEAFAARAVKLTPEAAQMQRHLIGSIEFEAQDARLRLVIRRPHGGQPCLDELEVYGPDSTTNLALASRGAVPRASSVLPGYASMPWRTSTTVSTATVTVGSRPPRARNGRKSSCRSRPVARVVFSRDRDGQFTDRQILEAEVRLSSDGQTWQTAGVLSRTASQLPGPPPRADLPGGGTAEPTWAGAVTYAFLRERDTWSRMERDGLPFAAGERPAGRAGGPPYWGRLARLTPLERTLVQFEECSSDWRRWGSTSTRSGRTRRTAPPGSGSRGSRFGRAFPGRAPGQAPALFPRSPAGAARARALRQTPSAQALAQLQRPYGFAVRPGGGICVLHIPRDAEGRLDPARAEVETLFDGSAGIVRHPVADFDAQTIYFAYRPDKPEVEGWHRTGT